jgi:hypothetical protein
LDMLFGVDQQHDDGQRAHDDVEAIAQATFPIFSTFLSRSISRVALILQGKLTTLCLHW